MVDDSDKRSLMMGENLKNYSLQYLNMMLKAGEND